MTSAGDVAGSRSFAGMTILLTGSETGAINIMGTLANPRTIISDAT